MQASPLYCDSESIPVVEISDVNCGNPRVDGANRDCGVGTDGNID